MNKYFRLRHYISFLRKQPTHMQHIYAGIVAGLITSIFVAFILYSDYGFWHDRYSSDEKIENNISDVNSDIKVESPFGSISRFFSEAKDQLSDIKGQSKSLLKTKDIYGELPK